MVGLTLFLVTRLRAEWGNWTISGFFAGRGSWMLKA